MEEIARRVYAEEYAQIEERMYQIAYEAYKQAIEDMLHALEYDIESVTRIGIDGCREIFEGKKAQKFISDHIMKEIFKQLDGKQFRKWLTRATHKWIEKRGRLSHASTKG